MVLSPGGSNEDAHELPEIDRPRRRKGHKLMRGRPITTEEFERMLAAVSKVRPRNPSIWTDTSTGLWLSGLRLEESTSPLLGRRSPISIDLSGRHPRFRIYAEAEKGRKDRLLPMTPDFAEFILKTPERAASARCSRSRFFTGEPVTQTDQPDHFGHRQEGGRSSSTRTAGKYASAHDLRRSFGTRWSSGCQPATLQLLMRHKSIETTLKYYVDQDADDVADELWKAHRV